MKVTGPNTGAPEAATPDAAPVSDGSAVAQGEGPKEPGSTGKSFANQLDQPSAAQASGAPDAAATSLPPGITADIAAELKAGKVQPRAAVEQVMERLLQRHLGADAPPAVREKLRAALQDTIDSDPFIAEKLRSLGE